jgi:hypothetical protein
MESGIKKKVAEIYLVDAFSHAEAEARTIKEMEPYASGEFVVSSVRRVNYSEVLTCESRSDYWWKVKVAFVLQDERSGLERRVNTSILAQGDTIEDAIGRVKESMKGSLADYEIIEARQSNILDIFIYGKD